MRVRKASREPKQFLCLTLEPSETGARGQRTSSHTDLLPKTRLMSANRPKRRSCVEFSDNRWTQSLADGCALMRVKKLSPSSRSVKRTMAVLVNRGGGGVLAGTAQRLRSSAGHGPTGTGMRGTSAVGPSAREIAVRPPGRHKPRRSEACERVTHNARLRWHCRSRWAVVEIGIAGVTLSRRNLQIRALAAVNGALLLSSCSSEWREWVAGCSICLLYRMHVQPECI